MLRKLGDGAFGTVSHDSYKTHLESLTCSQRQAKLL
jgi:hypothetical protein